MDRPSNEDVESQLKRILEADTLKPDEARLFRYIVEKKLKGKTEDLSGFRIAADLLKSEDSHDTTTLAGKVRDKLGAYYRGRGQTDPVEIEIPKPGYKPQWKFRDSPGTVIHSTGEVGRHEIEIAKLQEAGAVRDAHIDVLTTEIATLHETVAARDARNNVLTMEIAKLQKTGASQDARINGLSTRIRWLAALLVTVGLVSGAWFFREMPPQWPATGRLRIVKPVNGASVVQSEEVCVVGSTGMNDFLVIQDTDTDFIQRMLPATNGAGQRCLSKIHFGEKDTDPGAKYAIHTLSSKTFLKPGKMDLNQQVVVQDLTVAAIQVTRR